MVKMAMAGGHVGSSPFKLFHQFLIAPKFEIQNSGLPDVQNLSSIARG
jgi:hypothetical protein